MNSGPSDEREKDLDGVPSFNEGESCASGCENADSLYSEDSDTAAFSEDESNAECDDVLVTSDNGVNNPEETQDALLDELRILNSKLDKLSEQFTSRIARSDYEDRMLKQHSDEIQEYRSDLFKKITLPLLKEIINLREQLGSSIARAYASGDEKPTVPIAVIETYRDMLETILGNYSVELRSPIAGEQLTPGVERPVGKTKTGNKDMHGQISDVMGDAYLMDDKCIVPAQVKVYTYDSTLDIDEPESKGPAVTTDEGSGTEFLEAGVPEAKEQGEVDCSSVLEPAPVFDPDELH